MIVRQFHSGRSLLIDNCVAALAIQTVNFHCGYIIRPRFKGIFELSCPTAGQLKSDGKAPSQRNISFARVFCVDEKTAIQALDRLDLVLPLSPGRAERASGGWAFGRAILPLDATAICVFFTKICVLFTRILTSLVAGACPAPRVTAPHPITCTSIFSRPTCTVPRPARVAIADGAVAL